jgi:hypothetical protein
MSSQGCVVALKPMAGAHPSGPETNLTAVATFDAESINEAIVVVLMIVNQTLKERRCLAKFGRGIIALIAIHIYPELDLAFRAKLPRCAFMRNKLSA